MPSVIASWNGRLTDREAQGRLCAHLLELGELSHGCFEAPEPVWQYDQVIEGDILINGDLFGDSVPEGLMSLEKARESSWPGIQIRLSGPQYGPKAVGDELFAIERARIHGVAFKLYDGRNLYPLEDVISFVFLEADGCPPLQGAVVQVESHMQCRAYKSELIQGADWFIQRPQVHLRDYCEEWLDMLLSWAKYFYFPDLGYWRHRNFPNWDTLRDMYEGYRSGYPGMEEYSEVAFGHIKNVFMKNVEEWRETSTMVRSFWANVRQPDDPTVG